MDIEKRKQQVFKYWEQGLSVTEICKELNLSSGYISTVLSKILGKGRKSRFVYKRRVFALNEYFFDNIDNEAKAYFLGLLTADGNLAKNQNLVRISLQEKDKYILDKFNKCLDYKRPLDFIQKTKEIGWNRSHQYRIAISSTIFRKTLEKHGLHPNKSFTVELCKNVPDYLFNHYLRGYFDGDGCISTSKNLSRIEVSIATNNIFADQLIEKLKHFNLFLRKSKHSKNNCYYVRTSGSKKVTSFCEFLYKDATIYLERKREKYENWKRKG